VLAAPAVRAAPNAHALPNVLPNAAAKPAPQAPARPPRGTIALTFDDLPGLTQLNSQPYVDYINVMILRGLRHYHFPATGFVNEGKLALDRPRQIANLRRWLDAGMDLGNHTFSHNSPNQIGGGPILRTSRAASRSFANCWPNAIAGRAGSAIPIWRPDRPKRSSARSSSG
jgi:peptidoglycan/xylan/chitin deacetylase (PgdA/CDA1 family)